MIWLYYDFPKHAFRNVLHLLTWNHILGNSKSWTLQYFPLPTDFGRPFCQKLVNSLDPKIETLFYFSIMTNLELFPTYSCEIKILMINLLALYEFVIKMEWKLNCMKIRMILQDWLMFDCYSSFMSRCNVRGQRLIVSKGFGTTFTYCFLIKRFAIVQKLD